MVRPVYPPATRCLLAVSQGDGVAARPVRTRVPDRTDEPAVRTALTNCAVSAAIHRRRTLLEPHPLPAGGGCETGVMSGQESELVVVHNRRARHDYHLEDSWEAGIVLVAPGQGAARLPRVRPLEPSRASVSLACRGRRPERRDLT